MIKPVLESDIKAKSRVFLVLKPQKESATRSKKEISGSKIAAVESFKKPKSSPSIAQTTIEYVIRFSRGILGEKRLARKYFKNDKILSILLLYTV